MAIINSKNLYPRVAQNILEKQLKQDNIIVIVGSRQVGKTSLMALLYEKAGKKPKIYFDLEDIQLLDEFNSLRFDDFPAYLQEKSGYLPGKEIFVFIDEIQYLDNPSSFLKYIFDHYKKIKFIVSGSSTLEIKKKFSDRLTGRKYLHILYPLSFSEFLNFKEKKFGIREAISIKKVIGSRITISDSHKKQLEWNQKEIDAFFNEFVVFGGYPKIVLEQKREQKVQILKEIHATYVRKDIKDLAEIDNIKIYNDLVDVLASQSASLLNVDELSNTLNANRKTIERYLFLLENTFVINLLKPFFTNKRKEITKMPKLFLKDTGLRNMLIKNFTSLQTRTDKGHLVENFVFTELKKSLNTMQELYFWRTQTKAEVDFVIKANKQELIPIEVKYKKMQRAQIPSGLRSFITTYKSKIAFVITDDLLEQVKVGNNSIVYFLPAYLI